MLEFVSWPRQKMLVLADPGQGGAKPSWKPRLPAEMTTEVEWRAEDGWLMIHRVHLLIRSCRLVIWGERGECQLQDTEVRLREPFSHP